MAVVLDGWVLHIKRVGEQIRGKRKRTLGTYEVLHAGLSTGLSGMTVETKGPGDNATAGNGRCVEAGTYPLATQDGSHYKTIGYRISDDSDQTPKPGIELLDTGARTEILVHPGHGFLASIGCINLTAPLEDGDDDIPFADSRDRVIAAIDDLRSFLGDAFPRRNGHPIPRAWVVIDEDRSGRARSTATPAWKVHAGVAVHKLADGNAYTYRTEHVALDADGSPRAYHPQNTGIDYNANAGYPNGGWRSVLVVDPADPSKPFVQPDGPDAGHFVSKTSLRSHTLADTNPAAYVNSETIPYIVFPGAFYAIKGTGKYGDLAMVRVVGTGFEAAAIIADGGPKDSPLGEMSLKLASMLGGHNPNPKNGAGAPKGTFEYVVFPGSAFEPAWPRTLDEIDAKARQLLAAAGGWPETGA